MNCIKFTISGDFAHFKKPETNSSAFLTFSNIHKPCLLGIFGAIVGLKGYRYTKDNTLPEYYEKFKDLKIAIVTSKTNKTIFTDYFNNSSGHASREENGNMMVFENVIYKPSWDIYVLDDDSEDFQQLKENLKNSQCHYIPHLGKNENLAVISNYEEIVVDAVNDDEDNYIYQSLVIANKDDICEAKIDMVHRARKSETKFTYVEKLPVGLNPKTSFYEYENFVLTTNPVKKRPNTYKTGNSYVQFF